MYNYIEEFYSYVTTYSSLFSVRGKERRHLEGIPIHFDEFQVSLKTDANDD
jgi:hypothetical protein